jgi:hypothetical protein
VFLLSKRPRYFFDADAVREPHITVDGFRGNGSQIYRADHFDHNPNGRNVRSVWEMPEALVRLRGDLSEADRAYVLGELTKRGL